MRAIVQRVTHAEVRLTGQADTTPKRAIGLGLLVYLGVAKDDNESDRAYIVDKITGLRIFPDAAGKMNRNITQVGGSVLVVPAFTVQGDARKGRRPAFDAAADPDTARMMFETVCEKIAATGTTVARGVFRAHMHVDAVNDGPICVLLDSTRSF